MTILICKVCLQFRSFTDSCLEEGINRDGYRDQIVTRLHSGCVLHPAFTQYSNAHVYSVMYTSIRACFLYFFYNPYMSFFNIEECNVLNVKQSGKVRV